MRSTLIFALKVWLTTAIGGSVIFVLFVIANSPISNVDWSMMPAFLLLTILMAVLFSLPTLVVFYIIAYWLNIINLKQIMTNVLLIIIGLFGCALTIPFLTKHESLLNPTSLVFIACYAIPLILSVPLYKVRSAK